MDESFGQEYPDKNSGGEKAARGKFVYVLLAIFIAGMASVIYFSSTGYLKSKFSSDSVVLRRWAVDQVVKKGESAGPQMLELLNDAAQEVETRRLAVYVLGEVKYEKSAGELLKIFSESEHLVLRGQAAFALGRMGDVSALPELVSGYEGAPKGLKLKIISALGELGDKGGLALVEKAAGSGDDLLKQTAEYALIKITEKNDPHSGGGPRSGKSDGGKS